MILFWKIVPNWVYFSQVGDFKVTTELSEKVQYSRELFMPRTRIFSLILNSRRMFKNYQYFLVLKSNFWACFQDTFYLCGITPKDLRLRLWLVEILFFSRILRLVWGFQSLYENYTLGKITTSRCQQLQTIELEALLSNPKFQANLSA